MAPNRFRRDQREKREVTPFNDEPVVTNEIPAEWRDVEAPINFTWVAQDELAGMGWPKSRDQVRFLISQGIDHLITLSSDKLPPHYAFPELKWTMIPVEDFTGPTITDIKNFINIMDEARRDGEAVGVHCAEGRGRTGVMCACYLIYYHDIQPWDAIRIMRRQRPGSVERKAQEETVVRFFDLLNDYGKSTLEQLDEKEKEMMRTKKKQELNENMLCSYTSMFYGPTKPANKAQKLERMRRSRSMPKMNDEIDEAVKEETMFRKHVQDFFQDTRRPQQPRERRSMDKNQKNEDNETEQNRYSRAATPGRSSLMTNLKPAPRKSEVMEVANKPKCDFTKHFKDFMSTPSNVKRARSFSQPRDKDRDSSIDRTRVSSRTTSIEKCVEDGVETEKRYRVSKREPSPANSECSQTSSLSSNSSSSAIMVSAGPLQDKPVMEPDNREREERKQSVSSLPEDKPLPPKYKPKCNVDTSSTYSYYTRVRSRARERTEEAIVADQTTKESKAITSAPSSANTYRKFDPRKPRSKTVERDMCATVTVSEKNNQNTEQQLPTTTTTTTAAPANKVTVTRQKRYTGSNSSEKNDINLSNSPPAKTTVPARNEVTRQRKYIGASSAERNDIISTTTTTTTTKCAKKMENRTSSDSAKLEVLVVGSENKTNSRLSPFNRFRSSLVTGSTLSSDSNKTYSKASTREQQKQKATTMNGCNDEPQQHNEEPERRNRTVSTSTSERNEQQRRRYYYRKARTGPLPGEADLLMAPDPPPTMGANSENDVTTSNGHVNDDNHDKTRAKSEYNPRSSSQNTSTSSEYVSKENYFLAAAKRWASYDKPSYNTPFMRDSWKRSHRKFNYSRFLTYTRETFV